MRILWTHNFDPRTLGKGSFVRTAADGVRSRGIDLQVEYLGNLRSLTQLRRARAHVQRIARGFDLVHAQFGSACALVTAAVQGTPKLVTIRGSDWATHDTSFGFLYFHTRVATAFTRFALRAFDGIITVSRRVAAEVSAVVPGTPVTVLPSPIDLSLFIPRDKREARAQLGFPACEEKWVLFNSVDLHNPIKRFKLAKTAYEIAQQRCGNLRLRLATNLPHAQVALFAAACDVILCTSNSEGWPNSVKEALACNVPFVATDVSDLRDIAAVEPSCRVCPPDPRIIATSLCEVLANTHQADLRRHVADMSVEVATDRLIETYRSALATYRANLPSTVV